MRAHPTCEAAVVAGCTHAASAGRSGPPENKVDSALGIDFTDFTDVDLGYRAQETAG